MIRWTVWSILIVYTMGIAALAKYTTVFNYLLAIDITRLSIIIPALGFLVLLASSWMVMYDRYPDKLRKQCEFIGGNMPALGLFGTVVALWYILKDGIPSDAILIAGLGTAITTTAIGIGGAFILQQVALQIDLARKDKRDG